MPRKHPARKRLVKASAVPSFRARMKEIDEFFAGCSRYHRTLRRFAVHLERASIPYAIVGGMAVNAHGHRQTTDDVDLLLTLDGFAQFCERLKAGQFERASGRRWRFIDRVYGAPVDIVMAGTSPAWLRPCPVEYPDPAAAAEVIDGIRYVNLRTLLELKLACYRYRDFGDVAALIRVHNLDESFAERLHPGVRDAYGECLKDKHRQDEYEAREG
jgi:hypothetical protein